VLVAVSSFQLFIPGEFLSAHVISITTLKPQSSRVAAMRPNDQTQVTYINDENKNHDADQRWRETLVHSLICPPP